MTGSQDGVGTKPCKQTLLIEGPGMSGWFAGEGMVDGKWQYSATNPCLVLQEEYPLKAYASKDLSYMWEGTPMDGVVRNLAFKNSDTTINNFCPAPPPECGCYAQDEEIPIEDDKCVLALGSSFPDVAGFWSFTSEFKFNSIPDEPTDPRWFLKILTGIGSFNDRFMTSMAKLKF